MKILKGIWAVIRWLGMATWEFFTLAAPKADDGQNGVYVGGQWR